MGYHLIIAGKTDKGKKRSKNEDSFIVDNDLGFMIVADGMGGHASGEVASQLACKLTTEQLRRSLVTGHVPVFLHVPKNPRLDTRSLILGDCVKFSNLAVYEAAQTNPAHKNMGTTLVAALCLDDKLAIAHVGDSRLYTFQNGKLRQRTTDHSYVQEQLDRGLIKADEIEKSDMKNLLTRSVGIEDDVAVDLTEIAVAQGDYILLCSDGLTKMIGDQAIADSITAHKEPEAIADDLIGKANTAGGNDNITVVVARVEEAPSNWSSLADRVKNLFKKSDEGKN